MDIINIGTRREVFWDNYIIDTDKTTATHRIMPPIKKECCFLYDNKYETLSVGYQCIMRVDGKYRAYYTVGQNRLSTLTHIAVIESDDGINWTKPHLNIFPELDLEVNNAVINGNSDGFFVYYDENPDCPPEEKFKAIGSRTYRTLWCYTSPDGYHFGEPRFIADNANFDSLNTLYWRNGRYVCYHRGIHNIPANGDPNLGIRDVRVIYSKDFKNWTEPKYIEFEDGMDYPLYTNCISQYDRVDNMLIGFPTRHCERPTRTYNDEQMPNCEIVTNAAKNLERIWRTTTDCIFICSRDGEKWFRYNEAFITPGYENEHNWVYGDCYPSVGLVDSGKENYYMYVPEKRWNYGEAHPLYRYEIRKDGFACVAAGGEEKVVVTKPLTFDGSIMHLNFETSAYGYIYVEVLDENGEQLCDKRSFEIFGNSIDRKITFADGSDFSKFSDKPVRLKFIMRDAKLYSFKFD